YGNNQDGISSAIRGLKADGWNVLDTMDLSSGA
ncbi:MAG: hypothetical protein UU88_C0003G0001, partial [Parcubacteria group bacterium GW2011_GWC1_42_11]